jgi:hypothetical protein
MSHLSMAMGSVSIDDSACDLFKATLSCMLATAFATIAAVLAGKLKGISAEHLSKVWSIPHEDAAHILKGYHSMPTPRCRLVTVLKFWDEC